MHLYYSTICYMQSFLRNKTKGQTLELSSIVLEIANEAYTTQSESDKLFTTQSRVLQADWLL